MNRQTVTCYRACFVFIIFMITPLFSSTSGQINGRITDASTGIPIADAALKLFGVDPNFEIRVKEEAQSDRNGRYRFQFNIPAENLDFFIITKKKGYIPSIPDYYFDYIKLDKRSQRFRIFKMAAGQKRNRPIYMRKGGGFKLRIFLQKEAEKRIMTGGSYVLYWAVDKNRGDLKAGIDEIRMKSGNETDGTITIDGLEPSSKYRLVYQSPEMGEIEIPQIVVRNRRLRKIDHTIDCGRFSTVSGLIHINSDHCHACTIHFFRKDVTQDKFLPWGIVQSDKRGGFKNGCLPAGEYRIKVEIKNTPKKMQKWRYIRLAKGEHRKLGIIFNDSPNPNN